MDEHRQSLFERGILVLPEIISHDTYVMMLDALIQEQHESVLLYCAGDGGNADAALSIVDLIKQHGKVTGVLAGNASSSNAVIFAACQQRFVYPFARLGVHKVSWNLDTRVDSIGLHLLSESYARVEMQNAEVFAAASNKPVKFWYELFQQAGSFALKEFDAAEMIDMGLARPISECRWFKSPQAVWTK